MMRKLIQSNWEGNLSELVNCLNYKIMQMNSVLLLSGEGRNMNQDCQILPNDDLLWNLLPWGVTNDMQLA